MKTLLSIILILSFGFGKDILSSYDNRFEMKYDVSYFANTDEDSTDQKEKSYPAQAMVRSLVIPGWGQVYNNDSWWKPTLFAGIEIAGIVGWWQWNLKAEDLRLNYEAFADDYWDLENWVTGTVLFEAEALLDTTLRDISIGGGSHDLTIIYDGIYFPSDTLATPDGLTFLENATVLRNRDFYENIGKYDKFVAGWDDTWETIEDSTYALWWKENKEIEDGQKIVVMTKHKEDYLNQRYEANTYLNMATYAVSAIMFNHVISGLEAVWTAGKNKKEKEYDTSVGLMYNKSAPYGIGGISFSMIW